MNTLSHERDGSCGWLMHPGQDFDQRRFSRAVVANKGNDLTSMDIEFDIRERRYRAKILGDASEAEHSFSGRMSRDFDVRHLLAAFVSARISMVTVESDARSCLVRRLEPSRG